jgi:hypothetical protein
MAIIPKKDRHGENKFGSNSIVENKVLKDRRRGLGRVSSGPRTTVVDNFGIIREPNIVTVAKRARRGTRTSSTSPMALKFATSLGEGNSNYSGKENEKMSRVHLQGIY